jgi:cytochrome P450
VPTKTAIDPRFDENPTLPGMPDPWSVYRAVRESDPIHWCAGAHLWAVMRYDDAQTVLKDPRLSRQAYLDALEARTGRQLIIQMQRHELVFMDNPRHGELRQLIGDAINAQAVRDLRSEIDLLVDQKLAPLLSRGHFDAIGDFLLTLPTAVAAAWLGVPEEDREQITSWIFPLVSGRGVTRDPQTTAAASAAAKQLRAYFDSLVQLRRASPKDDLMSALLATQAQAPSLLTDDDLFALFAAVFAAGHTPGIALLAGTLLDLLQNPDQLARLRADPSLLPLAIEEGLRYNSPTQAPNPLAALEDISIRGKTIHKGDAVTVILASANRDPEVFPEPDRFDVGRTPNRHIAFSAGAHYCLGAMLTRLEAQSILAALVQRLPGLCLACGSSELTWTPHDRFRMLTALPVAFEPL